MRKEIRVGSTVRPKSGGPDMKVDTAALHAGVRPVCKKSEPPVIGSPGHWLTAKTFMSIKGRSIRPIFRPSPHGADGPGSGLIGLPKPRGAACRRARTAVD
jgi:hypothetical protein